MFPPDKFIGNGTVKEYRSTGQILVVMDELTEYYWKDRLWVVADVRKIGQRVAVYFGKKGNGAGYILKDIET